MAVASEVVYHEPEHIVSAARALLEQHGFAVVRTDAGRAPDLGPEAELAAQADASSVDWLNLFRATLRRSLQTRGATLPELARRLAVSPRTLQRQLAAHDTCLRTEINRTRRELAAALSQDGASNSLIALRLGYSDTRALRRALRRWTADG
jgi:AraC-like DNA-binding protein